MTCSFRISLGHRAMISMFRHS